MLELFYNYESWIYDLGAVFDMVTSVLLACTIPFILIMVSMIKVKP